MSKPHQHAVDSIPDGAVICSCRHCGKPTFIHDGRQMLAHAPPTCDEFTIIASTSESYESARDRNIVRPDAVLN